jgi:hypothetical protein
MSFLPAALNGEARRERKKALASAYKREELQCPFRRDDRVLECLNFEMAEFAGREGTRRGLRHDGAKRVSSAGVRCQNT